MSARQKPQATTSANECESDHGQLLTKRDVVICAAVASALGVLFWVLSHGASLRITFVPGLLVAFGLVVAMYRQRCPLPTAGRALPWYMATLAWQGLHFAEEFHTRFWSSFPALYGAEPYSPTLFVWVNMISYAVFSLATIAALVRGIRVAILPSLFFVVYGAIGNVISHITWAILAHGYFPGLATALGYLVLGPVLLRRMYPAATKRSIGLVALACLVTTVPFEVLLRV